LAFVLLSGSGGNYALDSIPRRAARRPRWRRFIFILASPAPAVQGPARAFFARLAAALASFGSRHVSALRAA